jgi:uncharacterized protein YyaL (SSP411 family)
MKGKIMNHLGNEKSPYLLQHKDNPVDWYPWGSEAFERARKEDKPIFLSIGYSTCHWCHVMAHESFEDPEVAQILNESFISVKVDREERPDIDAVYMAACQALTGTGGWPLTILMLPDQKPFFAGTYLPKNTRGIHTGLIPLLNAVASRWNCDREWFCQTGAELTELLKQTASPEKTEEPSCDLLNRAAFLFSRMYDEEHGGFGTAPKFPSAHNLLFLLAYSECFDKSHALEMALHTLKQMYRGGIFDHIGGGFSRYSTDEAWLVPHFEKMLYDNALLALAYLHAFRLHPAPFLSTAAERTLDYVLRELTSPDGGFFCGQDADSEGEEGRYYLWTPRELRQIPGLSDADADRFCRWYDISSHHMEGRSIPNLLSNGNYKTDPSEIASLRPLIAEYRRKRSALFTDDKVLAGWNGLMIAAMAAGYLTLEKESYRKAAEQAANFLSLHLIQSDGSLKRRYRDGEAAIDGQLEDYAFLAWGLLELYGVTWNTEYLGLAVSLTDWMLARFTDQDAGGFYLCDPRKESLIQQPKDSYDGALPSGNSAAALVLARLFSLTGNVRYQEASLRQNRYLTGCVSGYPAGFAFALLAFLEDLAPSCELVCAYARKEASRELLPFMRRLSCTNPSLRVRILVKTSANEARLAALAPFTAPYPVPDNGACYYLCRSQNCSAPVYSLEDVEALLKQPLSQ